MYIYVLFHFNCSTFQAMGCCGQAEEGDEDKKARKQNKEIEKQIQKDKQVTCQCRAVCTVATLLSGHNQY